MDLKIIKQVIDLMKRSELSEFELEEEGFKLRLSRKNGETATQILQAAPAAAPAPAPAAAAPENAAPAEEVGVSLVKSPMVGTFYRSPSPDSPAFVDVGAKISDDSVVCIIEAMKVMNEIQAETKGTIIEILVENGDSIEFGQPLFKVKK
ncbi:MAG: acetyl-CoA carboxylase biotin carboxyl carrier protein [Verrucomicrobia bacterium]|nr:acetyl-CoA carboxylase biotin carboxyl carrier protein [Verrucomicrobiota bacterium]